MDPVTIGLVGVGGYARAYLRVIDILEDEGAMRFHAAVIRNPARYPEDMEKLGKRGVLIRAGLDEMLEKDAADLDLVGIPTGIAEHRDMLVRTVEAGCDAVLEKPTTAAIQDCDAMIAALERTGRFCQIGYQNQAKVTVKALKRFICDGGLGTVRNVAVKCCGFRRQSYFDRNGWAGRLRDDQGRWILDGGLNNPYSHQLMNALYFARAEWGATATPTRVRGELYHAHDIESEDTCAAEIETAEGVTIHFLGATAGSENRQPFIEVVGDRGKALWSKSGPVQITFADGSTREIEDPGDDFSLGIMRNAVAFKRGEVDELDCPLPMTRNVVLATDGVFLSAGVPRPIAKEHLKIYHDEERDSKATEIPGIEDLVERGFAERKLFSDLGAPWAQATSPVSVENLTEFSLDV